MANHNTVTAEIAGEELKFSFNLWALVLAEEKGIDVADAPADKEEAEKQSGNLREMLKILRIARLPYDEDVTERSLGMKIGLGDLEAVTEAFEQVVTRQLSDEDVQEKLQEAKEEAQKDSGNAKAA